MHTILLRYPKFHMQALVKTLQRYSFGTSYFSRYSYGHSVCILVQKCCEFHYEAAVLEKSQWTVILHVHYYSGRALFPNCLTPEFIPSFNYLNVFFLTRGQRRPFSQSTPPRQPNFNHVETPSKGHKTPASHTNSAPLALHTGPSPKGMVNENEVQVKKYIYLYY